MKEMMYLKDVATLQLSEEKCNGCGMCLKVCPHAVFALLGKKAYVVDKDRCMECGACALNCKENAISVKSGVGCAAAIITGSLTNSAPTCGCGSGCN